MNHWISLAACVVLVGCGAASLTNPMVVPTENARAEDAYEAALVATQNLGYPVVANDPEHHSVVVVAKPVRRDHQAVTTGARFEIKALAGSVGIFVEEPGGQPLGKAEARALRRQMEQLAFAIDEYTRSLSGMPSSAAYPPTIPEIPQPSGAR